MLDHRSSVVSQASSRWELFAFLRPHSSSHILRFLCSVPPSFLPPSLNPTLDPRSSGVVGLHSPPAQLVTCSSLLLPPHGSSLPRVTARCSWLLPAVAGRGCRWQHLWDCNASPRCGAKRENPLLRDPPRPSDPSLRSGCQTLRKPLRYTLRMAHPARTRQNPVLRVLTVLQNPRGKQRGNPQKRTNLKTTDLGIESFDDFWLLAIFNRKCQTGMSPYPVFGIVWIRGLQNISFCSILTNRGDFRRK